MGGCCGTTPAMVKEMRSFLRSISPMHAAPVVTASPEPTPDEPETSKLPVPTAQRSEFAKRLLGGKFCISVELDPPRVETNIVRFRVTTMTAGQFVDACYERGVFMLPGGTHGVRAVTHMDVDFADVRRALEVMREVLAGA